MKFKSEKVSGLSGFTEVRFTEENTVEERPHDHFMVIADQRGVRLQGRSPFMDDQKSLQAFAKVVSDAWTAHQRLLSAAREKAGLLQ